MLPAHRNPLHPGEVLAEAFLDAMGVTQVALAEHPGMRVQWVNELVRGKRGVTADTAWLPAGAFGTTPLFWPNLETAHDLAKERLRKEIRRLRLTRFNMPVRNSAQNPSPMHGIGPANRPVAQSSASASSA